MWDTNLRPIIIFVNKRKRFTPSNVEGSFFLLAFMTFNIGGELITISYFTTEQRQNFNRQSFRKAAGDELRAQILLKI